MSQMSVKEKRGASKCSNMVTFNKGTTFSNLLLLLYRIYIAPTVCAALYIREDSTVTIQLIDTLRGASLLFYTL